MTHKRGLKLVVSLFAAVILTACLSGKSVLAETKGYWSTENAPEFYGTTKIVLKVNDVFDLKDARYRIFAKDFEDFDVSNKIQQTNNVDTSKPGDYKIDYSVTDSHGNTTTKTVPVKVSSDSSEKPMIERTMYSLPSVDNIAAMGIGRGDSHDRQMMGIFVKANSTVEARKISGNTATYTMLNNNSKNESSKTITNEWQEITFGHDYVPFVKTLRKQTTPLVLEFRWNHDDTGVKELNYLLDGDDESAFYSKWDADTDAYAVIDGEAVTVLIPYADRAKLLNHYKKHHKTFAGFFSFWKQTTDNYDKMLGLEYAPSDAANQNSKSKFFVRANANGGGAAYYAGDHVGINNPSVASFFEVNWGGLHEFGHGYQGTLGKGDLNIGEVSNNIFGYYIQSDRSIYVYNESWLGNLANIEQRENDKNNGTLFSKMDVTQKLYFMINMLDSFEGPDTYAKIATLYRKNVMNGITMKPQDAWALGIYESYNVNIIPYLESWNMEIAASTKLKIENSEANKVFALKDLVKDDTLRDQIKTDLGVKLNYELVDMKKLAPYKLKGNVTIKLQIDTIAKLKNKFVQLKNNGQVIASSKITGNTITFKDVPMGAYEVSLPMLLGEYTQTAGYAVVKPDETTIVNAAYSKVPSMNDNDIRIQFISNYHDDACVINLVKTENGMKLHFAYRPRGLANGGIADGAIYTSIIVRDASGKELYKKLVGKKEYFTLQSLEEYELPVKKGDTIEIMSVHGASRVKAFSTLNGDERENYKLSDNKASTFVITDNGIRPQTMSENDYMIKEYQARLVTFMESFVKKVTEAELYSKLFYVQEKSIIVRQFKTLSAENQKKYQTVYDAITKGYLPVITIPNRKIQFDYKQKIDLKSLISAFDNGTGKLGYEYITTRIESNPAKPWEWKIIYDVTDADGNVVSDYIMANVINYPLTVSKVAGVKSSATATTSITLAWNKVANVAGYEIYQYDTKTKKFKRIAVTKSTSAKVAKLKVGTTYRFKIRAYRKDMKGKDVFGAYSSEYKMTTKPNKVTLNSASSKKAKQVTVGVKKVSGVTGYQVSYSTSKKFTKKTTVEKTTNKTTYTVKSLKAKKTYYVRVRAYKTVNKVKVYGAWSKVKVVKVK